MRVYLVDDEVLALERLSRMLQATGKVEITGSNTDPVTAIDEIRQARPDVLFLDIHMPGLSGFQLLAELPQQPWVIFTTAYDQYALDAFRVNSVDYLLKPIEPEHLERALAKAERMCREPERTADVQSLLQQITASLQFAKSPWLDRIATRTGEKVEPIDLQRVTHFFADGKLTFAATPERNYVVDASIAELEQKLDPRRFIRIHRSTILNLDHLLDLQPLFGGRMVARLKTQRKTELPVSRDRASALKQRLGL